MWIAADKKNEIFVAAITRRKRTAYVTKDMLEKFDGMMHRIMGKWGLLNISDGTNWTQDKRGIIKINSFSCVLGPFHTYMPHKMV